MKRIFFLCLAFGAVATSFTKEIFLLSENKISVLEKKIIKRRLKGFDFEPTFYEVIKDEPKPNKKKLKAKKPVEQDLVVEQDSAVEIKTKIFVVGSSFTRSEKRKIKGRLESIDFDPIFYRKSRDK